MIQGAERLRNASTDPVPTSSISRVAAAKASTVRMQSVGPAPAAVSLRSSVQPRRFTPYLSAAQLAINARAHNAGFDLDALTQAGTKMRATNSARPYSAASLHFEAPTALGPKELVDAIAKMDLSPLKRSGIEPTACCDFDDTLARGDIFYQFCELLLARTDFPAHDSKRVRDMLVSASKGQVRKGDLQGLKTDAIMAKALKMGLDHQLDQSSVFFMMIAALKGMRVQDVEAVAVELFEKGAPGREPYKNHFFSKDGVSSIDLCKALEAKGISPHIITLGIPIVARVGARYLGIPPEHVHGSELEVRNGKFTGRAIDAGVVGKHVIADTEVSRTPLFCIGDTLTSDAPMLSRATVRAFVVNPRPEFQAHIIKNHADLSALSYGT